MIGFLPLSSSCKYQVMNYLFVSIFLTPMQEMVKTHQKNQNETMSIKSTIYLKTKQLIISSTSRLLQSINTYFKLNPRALLSIASE